MTTSIRIALALSLLLVACQDTSEERAAPRQAGAPGKATAALDPRTQYDLSRALNQVESVRDPDGVAIGYEKIRSAWLNRRYRWRVSVLEPLCRERDACNVLPFDRAGRDRKVVHGWMPRLVLDDTAFAAIQRACTGRSSCSIDMEGTLSDLVVDTEQPTSLEFRDVRIL